MDIVDKTAEREKLAEMIKDKSFDESLEIIRQNLILDPTNQYTRGGVVFQNVAKFTPAGSRRPVMVSMAVNHTPRSKYTGEMLRALRAERGVGQKKNRSSVNV